MKSSDKKKIKSKIEKAFETEILNQNNLDDAANMINEIFQGDNFKIPHVITGKDLKFTDSFLMEALDHSGIKHGDFTIKRDRKLTNIIFDYYYPKTEGSTFFHYTKLSALNGILKEQLFLSPLSKNANYFEYSTFYEDHDLTGYKRTKNAKSLGQIIMEQSYSLSLASVDGLTSEMDKILWDNFADNGGGIKIELEIISSHPDFRNIFYRGNPIDKEKLLLYQLNKKSVEIFKRNFTVAGISKIGAFYLPTELSVENEVRLIVKKNTEEYDFKLSETATKAILPFDSPYGQIKILKIHPGITCPLSTLKKIISDNGKNPDTLIYGE